jgi:hypothetical protein
MNNPITTDPDDIQFAAELLAIRHADETDEEFLPDPDLIRIFDTSEI